MNPEAQLQAGWVTAGLPSLDPSRRFQQDTRILKHEKQMAIHAEIDAKRDHAVAPDGDRDTTELRAAIGIPLHSSKVIENLSKLNPSLQFRHHPFLDRFQIFLGEGTNEKYVCAFEDGVSPQFEIYHVHEEEHVKGYGRDARLVRVKVLDGTTRGWVPLLKLLIQKRLIHPAETERVFGNIYSANWQETVRC